MPPLETSLIRLLGLILCLAVGPIGCRDNTHSLERDAASDSTPTFYEDVAPVVHQHCAKCHRPGQSAPFSLLTADDVQQRARQIAEVTQSGYMPPWLSQDPHGTFAGDRRLAEGERELLRRWAEVGAPLGDPARAAPLPTWDDGWQLGTPDLVIKMPEAYELRAEGPDDFRQFVVSVPIDEVKYVRAVEFNPGNKRIVHHANIVIDRTKSSRRLDAEDDEVGFYGMDLAGKAEHPPGQLITWVPGRVPSPFPVGTRWKLEPGTDLVLQFHMFPSGKPEPIQAEIGLYFGERPETPPSILVFLLENSNIDIAAGDDAFVLTDELVVPVDIELLALYPHLHYLGKEVEVYAVSPAGDRRSLLVIPDWDFNWQDVYRFASPLKLAAGTRLGFRYVFDNSENNPQNPQDPPRRVVGGNRSTDEMCHLWVQARAANENEVDQLRIAINDHRLEQNPLNERESANRGIALLRSGKPQQALEHYQAMAAQNPDRVEVQMGLGYANEALRQIPAATQHFGRAVELSSRDPEANFRLAEILRKSRQVAKSVSYYERAIEESPSMVSAQVGLGLSLLELGNVDRAQQYLQRASSLEPDDAAVLNGLGMLAKARRNFSEAKRYFELALGKDSTSFETHFNLGSILVLESNLEDALRSFETAKQLRRDDADIHCAIGIVQMRKQRSDLAAAEFRRALELDSQHRQALSSLAQIAVERGKLAAAEQLYSRLTQIASDDASSWLRLGQIKSRMDDPAGALASYRNSLEIQPGFQLANVAIGDLAMQQQKWNVAQSHYEKAMQGGRVPLTAPLNLSWLLATCPDASIRDGARAVQLAERCAKMTRYQEPLVLDRLAAAFAASDNFEQAVETAQRAVQLARKQNRGQLVKQIEERLSQYQVGKPAAMELKPR